MSLLWEAKVFFIESNSASSFLGERNDNQLVDSPEYFTDENGNPTDELKPMFSDNETSDRKLGDIDRFAFENLEPMNFFLWFRHYGKLMEIAQVEFFNQMVPNLFKLR